MTSATEVNCSVATSSSQSLPNNDEKPNQPKRLLFLKCDYGKISVKHVYNNIILYSQFSTSWHSVEVHGIHKSILKG